MNIPRTECKYGHPMTEDNKLRRSRVRDGKPQSWFSCRACVNQAAREVAERRAKGETRSHKKKVIAVGKFRPDPLDPDVMRAREERVLAIQRNPWLGTYLEKTA